MKHKKTIVLRENCFFSFGENLPTGSFFFLHSEMATSSTSLTNPQIPQFNGKNYDYWAITMKALFSSQDIWDLVENGFQELAYVAAYNALTQLARDF